MSEDLPDRMPDRMPERMSEDMQDRMSEDIPDRMPDRMSEDMPERMSEDLPDRMPDRMSEDMPDRIPDRMSEDMPDRMSEDITDRMPEDMPDRMSEDVPDGMPDRMSEDMPNRMSDGMNWVPWWGSLEAKYFFSTPKENEQTNHRGRKISDSNAITEKSAEPVDISRAIAAEFTLGKTGCPSQLVVFGHWFHEQVKGCERSCYGKSLQKKRFMNSPHIWALKMNRSTFRPCFVVPPPPATPLFQTRQGGLAPGLFYWNMLLLSC